jgi:hypothetical protein
MNEESKLTLRICLSIIGGAATLVAVIYLLWLLMERIL